MNYAMLHTHSVYSIRDSISTVDEYVKKINQINKDSEHRITSLALTEHGNLFSTLKLNNATKNTEVHPVYGVEMYHVLKDIELDKLNTKNTYHLILLAKTQDGLKNIMNISTHGGNHAKGHRFITSLEYIRNNNLGEGVVCLTACFGGYVSKHIDRGEYDKSKIFLEDIKTIFEETYLEIQPHHNFPAQIVVNERIKELSKETNTDIVLTTDTHYVEKEDRKYRDLLMHSKSETEEDEESEEFCDLHVHTIEELIAFCDRFGFDYSVIERTHDIASRCHSTVELDDPMALMPSYPCPTGYTEEALLREKAVAGLEFRLENAKELNHHPKEYVSRLEYELDVIVSTGFSGYFLILWDWFSWCKSEGIVLGPGRGSAAGSMLAYVLDITKVDPLKNGLIFERFLTRERAEVPD